MVKEQSEHNVVVYFVDYGYSMKMDEGHLRSITPQLLALPFQAIRCWLTGCVFVLRRKCEDVFFHVKWKKFYIVFISYVFQM